MAGPMTPDDVKMMIKEAMPMVIKGAVGAILEVMRGDGDEDDDEGEEQEPEEEMEGEEVPEEEEQEPEEEMGGDEEEQPPAPPEPAMRRQGCGAPMKKRMGVRPMAPVVPRPKPRLRRQQAAPAAPSATNGYVEGDEMQQQEESPRVRRMGRENGNGDRKQRLQVKALEDKVQRLERYAREQEIRADMTDLEHHGYLLDPEQEVARLLRFSAEEYEAELDRIIQRYQRNPDGGPAVPVDTSEDATDAIDPEEEEHLLRFAAEKQAEARALGKPKPEASDLIRLYRFERKQQGGAGPSRGERTGRPSRG